MTDTPAAYWNRIITGDYLETPIPAGSVQLIVTSPPYPGQRADGRTVEQWLDWFGRVAAKMARELTADGVLALNVKFKRRDDGRFDTRLFVELLTLLEVDHAFWPIDVEPWDKLNPAPSGALNGRKRHNIDAWEPVFLFGRSDDYPFYPIRDTYHWKTVAKSAGGPQRKPGVNGNYAGGHDALHPEGALQHNVLRHSSSGGRNRPRALGGSFPEALPARYIRQHTQPGQVVLDPFAGVGTTCRAAQRLGRPWLGVERDPDEAQRARRWLRTVVQPELLS